MNGSASVSQPGGTTAGSEWRSRSACRNQDPELFFPVPRTMTVFVQLARAKSVCRGCPVCWDCLHYALATGQQHGVWGGMSPEELRSLRGQLPAGAPVLPIKQAG
jgi:WhiB family transcriptional regulator, redox-sensing transcriptional regulator